MARTIEPRKLANVVYAQLDNCTSPIQLGMSKQTVNFYLKHQFSSLRDQEYDVEIDDGLRRVTVQGVAFDSVLLENLVLIYLPEQHGIVCYTDDDDTFEVQHQAYSLIVKIGQDQFEARAVLLSRALYKRRMAITLSK